MVRLNGWVSSTKAIDPVRTGRLVLTPITVADVDDLWRLYQDPRVAYWTGPWTRETVGAWAQDMATRWATDGVGKWLARDRSDGTLIGRGGLSRVDLGGETVLELGWVVRDAFTGRGFASEIGRAGLEWAGTFFPGIKVVAFTEVHNHASRAVMRRLGLLDSGIIYRPGRMPGRPGVYPVAPFAVARLAGSSPSTV